MEDELTKEEDADEERKTNNYENMIGLLKTI